MFYVTTPIYYVNDEPHLGHAYATILADVLARYARLQGRETFFLTGVDEHGQKAQNAARRQGLDEQIYVDGMHTRYRSAWQALDIHYDDFIRTTQPRHVRVVEQVLTDLWRRGEIYRGEYEGWYCVPDERFWTEKDLQDGRCPDCGREVERIVEPNYFFRMSAYQPWLVDYIQTHPDFIRPEVRRNEVLGFLRQPLGDLCISRPVERLSWGIRLPFDRGYVAYVWFDALLNYVTAAGYLEDEARFARVWPNALHLIGKDILTTHSVYWPTMLKAAGLPMPKGIFATGWWLANGMKMSKSLGNVVKPLEMAEKYGTDAFRFFLMREMPMGHDANFDEARLAMRYQVDLANNLGNLLHRVTHMLSRYCGGVVPEISGAGAEEQRVSEMFAALPGRVFALVEGLAVHQALAEILDALVAVNQYLEQSAPWKQAAAGERAAAGQSLAVAAGALRMAGLLLSPVMPARCAELLRRLGWHPPAPPADPFTWGGLAGAQVSLGAPLFPRRE